MSAKRPRKLRWKEGDYGVTNPGLFAVSLPMLRRQRPFFGTWLYRGYQLFADAIRMHTSVDIIREHLWLGSVQPALVASVERGRVAAYSIELDCVVMLHYEPEFLRSFDLIDGSLLLAASMYRQGPPAADIEVGPGQQADWSDYFPQIADFLSDDADRLAERKAAVPAWLWERTQELAYERLRTRPELARPGKP